MTGFDLGDSAPDADEELKDEPAPSDDPATEMSSTSKSETTDTTSPTTDEPTLDSGEDRDLDPTETGPAFPYSEVRQSPLYARAETWEEFEYQLDVELTPQLRQEGIRDDELREIHDIVLEVAIDNLHEFPERLKKKRQQSR